MNKIRFISVDFQKDFSSKGGVCYKPRQSVKFVKNILVPFLKKHNIKIAEIVSDYRQPRPGDTGDLCHPGTWGFESEISNDIKLKDVWIKCMNSPVWIRKNIGLNNKKTGLPYQDINAFNKWVRKNVGNPKDVNEVVLIGLTIDCCVLCVAQELCWRGYNVNILDEATDTYSGNQKEKEQILNNPPLTNWTRIISWKTLRNKL